MHLAMTSASHGRWRWIRARRPSRAVIGLLAVGLLNPDLGLAATAPTEAVPTEQQVDARLDQLFGAHLPYHDFLRQLQTALQAGDRSRIAGMVSYPQTVKLAGTILDLRQRQDFLAHYAQIFTPALSAKVLAQSYTSLFARDQGIMIGHGEIWFSGLCNDPNCTSVQVKIIKFNPAVP